jgi:hypothetical protein
VTANDVFGTADATLAKALATPFGWTESGLEPLPWFPFTVAASRGQVKRASRIAQRTERAYWYLRKLLRYTPRFRLLVLDRADWPKHAEVETYGMSHFTVTGNLVVGCDAADAWHDISRELARRLPAATVSALVTVHGADPVHVHAPDLGGVAERLVAHELARIIADEAGAHFPRHWMKHAFANYALVAVLGETDPDGLHRLGTLAEAVRALDEHTPHVATFGAHLTPFNAALVQLALTRAAYAAYAQSEDAPLARWFAIARTTSPLTPDADHELGRMLARDVHPAIGALAATMHDDYAQAA